MSLPALDTLSLEEQVAQMVVVRTTGHLFDHQIQYPAWEASAETLKHWLGDLGVGGVILLGGSAAEVGLRTQRLRSWAKYPLLISADIEEGVGQRFAGATWFPPPMAMGAIANSTQALTYARQMGAATAQEALAIGINWVLAPVVDVNNNPANPVINVRAFGETPEQVSQLAAAFIQGAQAHPVLTTAKHFPGHGDTAVDSHLELPVLAHELERLFAIELPPFKVAIAAGVDTVMTAHLQIPTLDPDDPATLSWQILTQTLRHQLGFEGLIVTDALVMGAIANRYGANEAAVLAVEAGADILLMPMDPKGAIRAVCDAVTAGRIKAEQIQAAVGRIWRAKQKVCSPLSLDTASRHAWEHVPPPPVNLEQLAQPETRRLATQILQDSMQIRVQHPLGNGNESSRNEPTVNESIVGAHGRAPSHGCASSRRYRNLVLVDDGLNCGFLGRTAPAVTLPQALGYQLQIVDRNSPPPQVLETHPGVASPDSAAESRAPSAQPSQQPTLLQLFIRGNPFRGSLGLTEIAMTWFQALIAQGNLQALVVYGSPYVMEQFQAKLPAGIPSVFTYGQMEMAQELALAALFDSQVLAQVGRGDRRFTT